MNCPNCPQRPPGVIVGFIPAEKWVRRCVRCWIQVTKDWTEEELDRSNFEGFATKVRSILPGLRRYLNDHPEEGLKI